MEDYSDYCVYASALWKNTVIAVYTPLPLWKNTLIVVYTPLPLWKNTVIVVYNNKKDKECLQHLE